MLTPIVFLMCSASVCVDFESVYLSVHIICIFVSAHNTHHPSRTFVEHCHRNGSREKWGYFQLGCMEGGECCLEGEAAICFDEKKMARLVLLLRL